MQSNVLVLAIMAALVLAGCSEPAAEPVGGTEDPQDPADPTPDDPGTQDPSSNGSDANRTNQPPRAELTASVLNGTAPLNVTFTLDGSDPDGDSLNWALSSNGTEIASGDTLPTNVTHPFEAGNATVVLTVSDGTASATATAQIVAAAGLAAPDPVHLTFEVELGCFHCYTSVPQVTGFPSPDHCVGLQAGENNQDCAWIEIDPAWFNREFSTSGPYDVDVAFYSECSAGNEIESVAAEGHDTGTILEGAGCLVVWDWDISLGGTITMDIV